ncbi:MAG TPA: hypothetical protein VHB98_00960 [Chloroflexota bacterium]|nr:hypothetical protein [Chloroflexota bacterium]
MFTNTLITKFMQPLTQGQPGLVNDLLQPAITVTAHNLIATNAAIASTALRIYPPAGLTALYVPARLSECLGTLGVLPVVAGTSGTAA